jgi:hypothetical protein
MNNMLKMLKSLLNAYYGKSSGKTLRHKRKHRFAKLNYISKDNGSYLKS